MRVGRPGGRPELNGLRKRQSTVRRDRNCCCVRRLSNADPLRRDLDRKRPLEERYRDHESMPILDLQHGAKEPTQRTVIDSHQTVVILKRPWLDREASNSDSAYRFDLVRGNRLRALAVTDDANYCGSGDNLGRHRPPKTAEKVTSKESALGGLEPIRPTSLIAVARKKDFVATHLQVLGTESLATSTNLHRKPVDVCFASI